MLIPELLAPAGTLEAVDRVLDAGADAVYLGGKTLNMRQHRAAWNFDEAGLATAISRIHARGRRVFLVVNSLLHGEDLPALRRHLRLAARLGPDALIVQDLAAVAAAREDCVSVPLHASTMMNVHNLPQAQTLRLLGFTRMVASRDLPLADLVRIARGAGLELEIFAHGDLCVAQSSQCHLSAQVFGESANRGRCLKPCRWAWELHGPQGVAACGHLLARKDLCTLDRLPEVCASGVRSLKIEGRMRSPEFLADLVAAYRAGLDAVAAGRPVPAEALASVHERRVREFTHGHTFGRSAADSIDASGAREPRQFSRAAAEPALTPADPATRPLPSGEAVIVARVGGLEAARAAVAAGAQAVYLDGDAFVGAAPPPEPADLRAFVGQVRRQGVRVAVLSPRITDDADLDAWRTRLMGLRGIADLGVGCSNLGALAVARDLRFADLIADVSFNLANAMAIDECSTLGATRATAAIELDLAHLLALVEASHLPVEAVVQGLLPGMVLEHCLIADAAGQPPGADCPQICHGGEHRLRDEVGQDHLLLTDARCRNHLFMASETCLLPQLPRLAASRLSGLRIEAPLAPPEVVTVLVGTWRQALDAVHAGRPWDAAAGVAAIAAATGRPQGDGPYACDRIDET